MTTTRARPSTASTSNQVRTNVSPVRCDELLLDAPRRFGMGRSLVAVCYLGVDLAGVCLLLCAACTWDYWL
jgi:hypothetical protein